MASIFQNRQRLIYQVQWFDGQRWSKVKVGKLPPGAKDFPRRVPPEVLAALAEYQRREDEARLRRPGAAGAGDTVARFLAAYRAHYETGHRPGSVKALDLAIGRFLAYAKEAKVKGVADVTPAVADAFVAWQYRSVGHSSVRQSAALLAGAWSRAVKLRALADNPWKGVTVPGEARRRTSSWTREEYEQLRAACRPWLRNFVTLGCNTGLRVAALCSLEWRDVRWGRPGETGLGAVVVRPELDKAKAGYEVPLSAEAHDLLASLDPGTGEGPVLRNQAGNRVGVHNGPGVAIRAACRRAGLPSPDSPCHAMRRTFGRWAVLGTLTGRPVPLYVVSRWMGHASVTMTEAYLALSDQASQEWMTGQGAPVTP